MNRFEEKAPQFAARAYRQKEWSLSAWKILKHSLGDKNDVVWQKAKLLLFGRFIQIGGHIDGKCGFLALDDSHDLDCVSPRHPRKSTGPGNRTHDSHLIALDGKLAGASLRQIAEMLLGADLVADDWENGSRFSRERARRAVSRGVALMNGGWRELLV